jgi:hypothetical protein
MKKLFPFLLSLSQLILAPALLAKGQTVKVVVTGSDLVKPIEILDPNTLINFQVWANSGQGFIVDWSSGTVRESPKGLMQYEVSFYVNEPKERVAYVVLYAFDSSKRQGYVYIPGKSDDHYCTNVGSIFRGVEGNWFHAWTVWDNVAVPLITKARASSSIASL